uniref:Uncharacterized protein n=1 Tax=Strongyloides venezuelensis TaxID=75913 RepID=A0A0K0F602_STRVS
MNCVYCSLLKFEDSDNKYLIFLSLIIRAKQKNVRLRKLNNDDDTYLFLQIVVFVVNVHKRFLIILFIHL